MTFGENCKKYRLEKHMTQQEVALTVGISKRMYIYYETGNKIPRKMETVLKLADCFGVDVNQLIVIDTKAWVELQRSRPAGEIADIIISESEKILSDTNADPDVLTKFCKTMTTLCEDYLRQHSLLSETIKDTEENETEP